jgi:hypothetical protein
MTSLNLKVKEDETETLKDITSLSGVGYGNQCLDSRVSFVSNLLCGRGQLISSLLISDALSV